MNISPVILIIFLAACGKNDFGAGPAKSQQASIPAGAWRVTDISCGGDPTTDENKSLVTTRGRIQLKIADQSGTLVWTRLRPMSTVTGKRPGEPCTVTQATNYQFELSQSRFKSEKLPDDLLSDNKCDLTPASPQSTIAPATQDFTYKVSQDGELLTLNLDELSLCNTAKTPKPVSLKLIKLVGPLGGTWRITKYSCAGKPITGGFAEAHFSSYTVSGTTGHFNLNLGPESCIYPFALHELGNNSISLSESVGPTCVGTQDGKVVFPSEPALLLNGTAQYTLTADKLTLKITQDPLCNSKLINNPGDSVIETERE